MMIFYREIITATVGTVVAHVDIEAGGYFHALDFAFNHKTIA